MLASTRSALDGLILPLRAASAGCRQVLFRTLGVVKSWALEGAGEGAGRGGVEVWNLAAT